ncbi:hypothetical protein MMC15_006250 [Xylographa vitiligo]|nr:hypothetical protein [Xylographa vitiligo]
MPFVATNLPFQRQFRRKYVAVGAAGGVFISNCCNCSDLLLSCQYGSEPPSKLSIAYLSKDGSVASELVPCNFDAAFSSCCPSANANDLYPLDYPNCQIDGLCQAGNSDFLARGGCTDPTFGDESCPGVPQAQTQVAWQALPTAAREALGIAAMYYPSPSLSDVYTRLTAEQADHDAGTCNCSPASGSAFQLTGDTAPLFFSTDPSATPGPGSNPTLHSGAVASPTSNAPSTMTSKTSMIAPSSTTTIVSTSTSSMSTASSIANSQLTLTEYTTIQASTTAVGSNVLPPAGVTSATGTIAGSSPSAPAAIASKAGSWNLGVQREIGYLAGAAAGLGSWLL